MSILQEVHPTLLCDEVHNIQTLSTGLNDQVMECSLSPKEVPVSNNEVKSSSSDKNVKKLTLPYVCATCSKRFSQKNAFMRHEKFHLAKKSFSCNVCEKTFVQKGDLQRHIKIHSKMHKCNQCSEVFSGKYELIIHRMSHKSSKKRKCYKRTATEVISNKSKLLHDTSPKQSESSSNVGICDKVNHFKRQNVLSTSLIYSNEDNDKDFRIFLYSIKSDILNELNYQMEEKKKMKWNATMQVVVSRLVQNDYLETDTPYFQSKTVLELINNNLSIHIEEAFEQIINNFEMFTKSEYGWTLEKILNFELTAQKYTII